MAGALRVKSASLLEPLNLTLATIDLKRKFSDLCSQGFILEPQGIRVGTPLRGWNEGSETFLHLLKALHNELGLIKKL